MFQDVQKHITNTKSKDSCNLINKTTGTKLSKEGIIRQKNKKDSISKWYVPFQNMLGLEPVVKEGLEEYIEASLNNFMIADYLCTKEENTKAKNELNG